MDFTICPNETFVIVKGLVVPEGSIVRTGITIAELPKDDTSILKLLFGPIKKKVAHDEEEDFKAESSCSEDSEDFDESESEEEHDSDDS
jgi:hypothetical protein